MEHWWTNYPWRMIQTNMRQIDMEDIDAQIYANELKKMNASVVLINVGGIMASYESKVEDHTISEYLHGDSLKKCMDACHDAGIKVLARMDFSKVRRPVYEKHPDWAYRTREGKIVDYNGDVHACICGGFQQEKAFEIIREVCTTLPIDGLFINMGGFRTTDYSYNYYGICHCDNCKRKFFEMFGLELPDAEDMNDPVFRKHKVFQRRVMSAYKKRLVETIRAINPEIGIDGVDFTRMETNTEYKRALPFWQYSAASNTRGLHGIDGGMVSSNTSVDFIGFFYRHVAVNPEEQQLRLWQDVANFGGVDYYLIGRLDNHEDKSGFEGVKRVFTYKMEHEDEYRGVRSISDILVIRGALWDNVPEERGWIRALTEAHMLFDEALLTSLKEDSDLSGYKVIILPGTASIPTWFARKLDLFAADGGCVISSANSGVYDEDYNIREQYPFECMGIEKVNYVRNDMVSAMLHVEEEDLKVFDSYADDRVLYFGDEFFFADYKPSSRGYLKLIPPHPFGPPERCYYTQITGIPGVQVNSYGKGKGVLIPWTCGLLYNRDGYANTFRFMRDLIKNIAGIESVEESPFTPMIAITVGMAQDGSRELVQVVNNSGHFGTSFFTPIPVYNIALKVPCRKQPATVVSQTTGNAVPYTWKDGKLSVQIDCPDYFEGLAVKF